MTITVELPDDIASHEHAGREALESLVIEGYRTGALSQRRAAAMLGLYWYDFDGLLKERGVTEGAYDEEAYAQDMETIARLRPASVNR